MSRFRPKNSAYKAFLEVFGEPENSEQQMDLEMYRQEQVRSMQEELGFGFGGYDVE